MNWKFWEKKKLRYKHVVSGFSANLDQTYKEVLKGIHKGEIIRLDIYKIREIDYYFLTFWSDVNNYWSEIK